MNPIAKLQKWMDSPSGQVFMNYAYSWGAAVVILGTLFKLTHIPGANLMLFIGMGTEVFVFFISGFEKTYEKVPSQDSAVSGGGQTRVFEITGGSTLLPVVFDSIQVTGGAAENGAGIWNDGVLVLRNSLVAGNTASNSGGGLWNQGELTALNTTIAANTALSGAGV